MMPHLAWLWAYVDASKAPSNYAPFGLDIHRRIQRYMNEKTIPDSSPPAPVPVTSESYKPRRSRYGRAPTVKHTDRNHKIKAKILAGNGANHGR